MKRMLLKSFIRSKAAEIWDECSGNWIVWDHYNPDNNTVFFKVFKSEPQWNKEKRTWEANEAAEYFTASLDGIELTDLLRPTWELKFPINRQFGQTFSA